MPERVDRSTGGAAMREVTPGQGIQRGLYQDRLRAVLSRELAAGHGVRRDFYHVETPGASIATRTRMARALMQAEGKENVPPASALRKARAKKSPLPVWYARTPLRDITALVDAMERRRASLRSAARQRRTQYNALSPSSASPVTPSPGSLGVAHTDPVLSDVSHASPGPNTVIACPLAAESSPRTPCLPANAVPDDKELAEREVNLEKSIDAIEKLVRENLNRKPKAGVKKTPQRSKLMLMR